ncbi:tetratricopeptide repeat protein [Geobacter pelophilus]|uniref:Tetratricopeptide repeat protein n=1 Tax=Geoanaerobacter pelophilus TaxID=60036 RepID=A0AAW4KY11_9BACT|nr:tetratricopeptide repeat protein [Geoanaerobacter pelophilus]MBT0663433.1 tetratricopeptide repeat protein [Geoanaerobacter pelophilus]
MKASRLPALGILAVLTLGTYCRGVVNGFVTDDHLYLLGMDAYKQFDIIRIFTTLANGIEYLPVRDLTLAVDYAMFGESAAWLHFSNYLYFLLAVFAVYFLAVELVLFTKTVRDKVDDNWSGFLPLFAASLFAVHPLNGEAANWISGRNVILGGLFFSLSALFYLKSANAGEKWYRNYLVSLGIFLLALLSKATVIILPAVLFCIMMVFSDARKRHAVRLIPFFALSLAFFFVLTEVAKQSKIIVENAVTGATGIQAKLAVASQIPYFYVGKFLFPANFTTHYVVKFSRELLSLQVVLAIFGLVALILLALTCRKRSPEVTLGILWFLISLIPVLNFFATYPVVADRYLFIPMFGLVFLSSVLLVRLGSFCGEQWRNGAAVVVVLIMIAVSCYRVGYWKDEKSIWGVTVKNSPQNIAGYVGLGAAYFNEGSYEKALEYYSKTREMNPPNVMYEIALGKYYTIKGQLDEAIKVYGQAVRKKPDSIESLYSLGEIYFNRGDFEQARGYFLKIFDSREQDHRLVAKAKQKLKTIAGGSQGDVDSLQAKLAQEPGNLSVRGELALKLDGMGLYDEALRQYLEMERQGMNRWQLQYNIANVYKKKKMFPDAANYFRLSLKANPENPDAWNNLGVVCREMREYADAIKSFEKAMAVQPLFAYAPLNLALTYQQMGDKKNADRLFAYTKDRFPELSTTVDNYMKE